MPLFAEISLPQLFAIGNVLGLPGLIVIFWYMGERRMAHYQRQTDQILRQYKTDTDRILQQNKEDMNRVLQQNKDNIGKVTRYYEANVELVERYEKTSASMADIILNNTLIYSKLVEKIDNNLFCPIIREKGPRREG